MALVMDTPAEQSQDTQTQTGADQETDATHNSQDASVEGNDDNSTTSYEEEKAALLRGEEPEVSNANESQESEDVTGEEDLNDDSGESTEESDAGDESESGETRETGNEVAEGDTKADEVDIDSLSKRRRLKAKNDVDKLAFEIYSRNEDFDMAESIKRAEAEINPQSEDQGEPKPDPIAEAKAELKDLKEKRNQALDDYEPDDVKTLDSQIDEIADKIYDLKSEAQLEKVRDELKANNNQSAYEAAESASWDTAEQLYPDALDENSPLMKLAGKLDIANQMDKSLVNSPDRPLLAVQEAAKILGIQEAGSEAQAKQPAPAKAQTQQRRPVTPARGNKTTQTTSPANKQEAKIGSNVTDADYLQVDSYEKAKAAMISEMS
jgi:hypothetical protein